MYNYLIALDDGHGMQTPGKRTPKFSDGSFMHENEFNSAVVRKLDTILKRCGLGTMYTAPTDADTPLRDRTSLANLRKATLFISVHANALDGSFKGADPSGVSTHYYPTSEKSKELARCVHNYLIKGTPQKDRGITPSNFHVLRESKMPAVLIEAAFMDNIREARLLRTDKFRQEVAEEIAKGICAYLAIPYVEAKQTTYSVVYEGFKTKELAESFANSFKAPDGITIQVK